MATWPARCLLVGQLVATLLLLELTGQLVATLLLLELTEETTTVPFYDPDRFAGGAQQRQQRRQRHTVTCLVAASFYFPTLLFLSHS